MSRYDLYNDRFPVPSAAWLAVKPLHGCQGWSLSVDGGTILRRGLLPGGKATLDAGQAVVDAGGGKVQIPAAGSGFRIGDTVEIFGMENYPGSYTLTSGTTDNLLEFAETYIAENVPALAYAKGYRDLVMGDGATDREDYSLRGPEIYPEDTIFYVKALSGSPYLNMAYRR